MGRAFGSVDGFILAGISVWTQSKTKPKSVDGPLSSFLCRVNAGWQASWFLKVRVVLEFSISPSIFLFPFLLKCSRTLDSLGEMETQDKKVMSAEGCKLRSKDHRCEGAVTKREFSCFIQNVSICLSYAPLLLVLFIAFEVRRELEEVPPQFRSRYYTRLLAGWIYWAAAIVWLLYNL